MLISTLLAHDALFARPSVSVVRCSPRPRVSLDDASRGVASCHQCDQ